MNNKKGITAPPEAVQATAIHAIAVSILVLTRPEEFNIFLCFSFFYITSYSFLYSELSPLVKGLYL